MAWSYRQDRADEVYASTSGPAAATTEQLPRPPMDGEDTDSVLNPEVPEPKKGEEKAPPTDPEAPKPPTLTVEEQAVKYQQEQAAAKGQADQPAPPPTPEEQQKAVEEARGTSGTDQKKPEEKPQPAPANK